MSALDTAHPDPADVERHSIDGLRPADHLIDLLRGPEEAAIDVAQRKAEDHLGSDEVARRRSATHRDHAPARNIDDDAHTCFASVSLKGEEKSSIEANGADMKTNLLHPESHAQEAKDGNEDRVRNRARAQEHGPRALEGNQRFANICNVGDNDDDGMSERSAANLAAAARSKNNRLILALARSGAAVDSEADDGWTALHTAVAFGNPTAIAILVRHGADTNHLDPDGDTPLATACSLGLIDCVQQLLAGGADPTILTQVCFRQRYIIDDAI